MLLILEIAMLIGGIYAIVSAKIPSFLLGGGKYQVDGTKARLIGILLILPLPIAFLGGIILSLLFEKDTTAYAFFLELITVIGVALIAMTLTRTVGKRVEPINDIEKTIIKKTQGALMYAVFSITGFAALVCCPLAIVYANQALKLIDENNIGEEHRNKAKTARVIAIVATVLWAVVVIFIAAFLIAGTQ